MKKKYVKPDLFMDSFEVAEFVAGTCELVYFKDEKGKPNAQDKATCMAYPAGPHDDNDKIFLSTTQKDCIVDIDINNPFDNICYNTPFGVTKTWLS